MDMPYNSQSSAVRCVKKIHSRLELGLFILKLSVNRTLDLARLLHQLYCIGSLSIPSSDLAHGTDGSPRAVYCLLEPDR